MAICITEAEIFDALANAAGGTGPEEARTIRELAKDTGVTVLQAKRALHIIAEEGRLVPHRVNRPRMDGIMTTVSAYTILPAK